MYNVIYRHVVGGERIPSWVHYYIAVLRCRVQFTCRMRHARRLFRVETIGLRLVTDKITQKRKKKKKNLSPTSFTIIITITL